MTTHPTALSLARLATQELPADGDVARHLEQCGRCQLAHARLSDWNPTSRSLAPEHAESSSGPTVRSFPTAPARGQLRQLRWDHTAELGLLTRVEEDQVLVRLVLPEGGQHPLLAAPVLCSITDVPVSVDTMLWGHWMSPAVLGAAIGETAEPDVAPEDILSLDQLEEALSGDELLITDVDMDLLDWIQDVTTELVNAESWAPHDTSTVRPLTTEQWISIGITPRRALDIGRGAAPTPEELTAAEQAGQSPTDSNIVPDTVRRFLNNPVRKQLIVGWADDRQMSEVEARRQLAAELREPIAARTIDDKTLPLEERFRQLMS